MNDTIREWLESQSKSPNIVAPNPSLESVMMSGHFNLLSLCEAIERDAVDGGYCDDGADCGC